MESSILISSQLVCLVLDNFESVERLETWDVPDWKGYILSFEAQWLCLSLCFVLYLFILASLLDEKKNALKGATKVNGKEIQVFVLSIAQCFGRMAFILTINILIKACLQPNKQSTSIYKHLPPKENQVSKVSPTNITMSTPDFCTLCNAPAEPDCYSLHPVNSPSTPDLEEALYGTIDPTPIPPQDLAQDFAQETDQDTDFADVVDLCYALVEQELNDVFQRIKHRDTTARDERRAFLAKKACMRFGWLVSSRSFRKRRHTKSMVAMGLSPAEREKHVCEISEIQERTRRALDVIDEARKIVPLVDYQASVWEGVSESARMRIGNLEERKREGDLVDMRAAGKWVKRLEGFSKKMEDAVKSGVF